MFRDMWIMDVVRGEDSAGVAFINSSNHISVAKAVGIPQDVMASKGFRKAYRRDNICIIGHNRWATVGEIVPEMAHPFLKGKICGTHNGTIKAQWRLPDHKDFESDSENLFHSINKTGLKDTWKNTEGAAALAYWDKKDKTLNLIRNNQRPLFFSYIGGDNEGPVLFWASETWMLTAAANRRKLKLGQIWNPSVDTLFKFQYNNKTKKVTYKSEKIPPFTWKTDLGFINNVVPWEKRRLILTAQIEKDEEVVDLSKKDMTKEKFLAQYSNCCICHDNLSLEYLTAVILDERSAICGDCADPQTYTGVLM